MFLRRQALECGYLKDEVDSAVRRRQWIRIRRGAYVEPALVSGASDFDLHRLRVRAVVAASQSDPVVSGVSAAVMHGLDLVDHDLDVVQLTHPGVSSRREADVRHLNAALDDDEVVWLDGLRVTSVARTAIDVARDNAHVEAALPMLDSALRNQRTTRVELNRIAEMCSRWPNARGLWRMVQFADGRSANPGETRLRLTYSLTGLPPAEPQLFVYRPDRTLVAITDLAVLSHWTLLELDGRMKYGMAGQDPAEQVYGEKVREDDLRTLGHEMVRFGYAAAGNQAVVQQRVLAAFERAAHRLPPTALYRVSAITPTGVAASGPYLDWRDMTGFLDRARSA